MPKKVLVTGADGFIGSHLTEALTSCGYQVRALSQYNSFNRWGWLEAIDCLKSIEVVTGDIRDPFLCKSIMRDIDYVFHLAALIAIPYSYISPDSYIETNVKGTLNICQAAKDCGVEKIIHTSTSEVYGTAEYVPIDEKHPLQPQSPYSASKISADALAMSFYYAFDLPLVIARPFNTYGPRQSARAVIPTIISQILAGRNQIELGDTSPTRDFTYVEDTCRAFILLAETSDTLGKIFNIGANQEISIADLLLHIKRLMKSDVEFVTDPQRIRPQGSEVFRLWCDNKKLRQLTAYQPEFTLEKGLQKTIDWFTQPGNLQHYKADIYNV